MHHPEESHKSADRRSAAGFQPSARTRRSLRLRRGITRPLFLPQLSDAGTSLPRGARRVRKMVRGGMRQTDVALTSGASLTIRGPSNTVVFDTAARDRRARLPYSSATPAYVASRIAPATICLVTHLDVCREDIARAIETAGRSVPEARRSRRLPTAGVPREPGVRVTDRVPTKTSRRRFRRQSPRCPEAWPGHTSPPWHRCSAPGHSRRTRNIRKRGRGRPVGMPGRRRTNPQ